MSRSATPALLAALTALTALSLGAGAAPASAEAPSKASTATAKTGAKKSTSKSKAKTSKSKAKSKAKTKAKSKTKASKATGEAARIGKPDKALRYANGNKKKANMPAGWAWPPSRAMKDAGAACLAKLDELGVAWKQGEKLKAVATPVIVPSMEFAGVKVKPTFRKPPFTMDCHLALGLATFGAQLHALGVREIKFSSIYRYDTVTVHGKKRGALSRHALGLAMDIRAFVDAAGNEATVLDHYNDGNELLLGIEQFLNDSGGFRTVLTPRNDPDSHYDHYHIEIKVDYATPTPAKRKKPTT